MRTERLGNLNPRTANAHHDLGVVLRQRREYEGSEHHLRQALTARSAIAGPPHPDAAITMRELALVLRTVGRGSEADSLLHQSRQILVERLGADDPETRRTSALLTR